jgi:hypothetical protein
MAEKHKDTAGSRKQKRKKTEGKGKGGGGCRLPKQQQSTAGVVQVAGKQN